MKELEEIEWFSCGLLPVRRLRFGLPVVVLAKLNGQALDPLGPPVRRGADVAARVLRAMSNYGNMRGKLAVSGWRRVRHSVPSAEDSVRSRFAAQGEHLWPAANGHSRVLPPWPPYERGRNL